MDFPWITHSYRLRPKGQEVEIAFWYKGFGMEGISYSVFCEHAWDHFGSDPKWQVLLPQSVIEKCQKRIARNVEDMKEVYEAAVEVLHKGIMQSGVEKPMFLEYIRKVRRADAANWNEEHCLLFLAPSGYVCIAASDAPSNSRKCLATAYFQARGRPGPVLFESTRLWLWDRYVGADWHSETRNEKGGAYWRLRDRATAHTPENWTS